MREQETRSRSFAKEMRRDLTNAEAILWAHLRKGQINGWRFRRQHPIGPYIADFACAKIKLVIEVDGATHGSAREQAADAKRSEFLESKGWRVLRVWNTDIHEAADFTNALMFCSPSTTSWSSSPVNGGGKNQAGIHFLSLRRLPDER